MRRIGVLALAILFLSSSAIVANGQSEEKTLIIEENINYSGPFWYSVSCLKVSCPGLSLEIIDGLENYNLEDDHFIEWAGELNSSSVVRVLSNSGVLIEDVSIQTFEINEYSIIEDEDLIDSIPSPGNQDSYYTIVTSDICSLGKCNSDIEEHERKAEYVGILENYSDQDSIKIFGEFGDVIEVSQILGDENLRMEVWHRNNQQKVLITNNLFDSDNYFIDYPEDSELWLRINSDSSKDSYPYKFILYRNNQSQESPTGGELTVPWIHGDALTYQESWFYESYISKLDKNGDSLLFNLGSDTEVNILCSSSNSNMIFETYLISHSGVMKNISLENGTCPETILSNEDTVSVEFWIKSEETGKWNITINPIRPLDGGALSDAPETRWLTQPDNRWSGIQLEAEITGSLHNGDNVDIYLIEISDLNGSRIYLNELFKSEVNYTIQEINQDTGQLVNTSNGQTIVLPLGNHSLRIERRADLGTEINYIFKLEYLGEYQEPEIKDSTIDTVFFLCKVCLALLLIGHSGFGFAVEKKMLIDHWQSIGVNADIAFITKVGYAEFALGVLIFIFPLRPFIFLALFWKLFTEFLYVPADTVAGMGMVNIFEWIERWGDYGVPLIMLYILSYRKANDA